MPFSKRELLATCSRYAGLTHLLRLLPSKPALLVLNYHRIGNPEDTPYDPGVFSATAETLDAQLRFLKKRFHIATLDEAADIVVNGRKPRTAVALLTFDDGYLDNYRLAFRILSSHRVQGVFFLTSGFIGSNQIPWWDAAAYIIKRSRTRMFRLGERRFDIDSSGLAQVIEGALSACKTGALGSAERFISMLEEECGTARPDGSERCFINWSEAAEMAWSGMAIGSHTHTHPILSALSREKQVAEFAISRSALERNLGVPVRSVAYPYGLCESMSPATFAAAKDAGYHLGFSFYGGLNSPGSIDPYNVHRYAVGGDIAQSRFQLAASVAALTGKFAA